MSWYLVLAVMLSADATPAADGSEASRIYDQRTGEPVAIESLADELARRDVVFLGEDHDHAGGHRFQKELLEALYARRPELVLSLEMFERDVQGILDDYLRGRIDEKTFLEQARPWKDYASHYRPLVEFAREKQLDVLAANVPRKIAKGLAEGTEPADAERMFLPRTTTTPQDAYWERFVKVMQGHAGTDGPDAITRYYRAQCLKDDGMAEAITDFLMRHPHRRSLVVHVCGKFHSDYGQGTVLRVLSRRPLGQVGVVSMESAEDLAKFDPVPLRDRSHFLLVVQTEAKPDTKGEAKP